MYRSLSYRTGQIRDAKPATARTSRTRFCVTAADVDWATAGRALRRSESGSLAKVVGRHPLKRSGRSPPNGATVPSPHQPASSWSRFPSASGSRRRE